MISSKIILMKLFKKTLARKKREVGSDVIQLQGNIIPPYFVSLEKLYNRHDTYIKKKRIEKGPTTSEYEGVNIGDIQSPEMINIKKCCTSKEKELLGNFS